MESREFYRIGEFSKLSELSVRTLRYYDEIGLLNPDIIDNFTGYRYYTDKNLYEAYVINILKGVNFSLEEIIMYKNNLTEEVFDNKINEIDSEIQVLEEKKERLLSMKEDVHEHRDVKVLSLGMDKKVA